MTDYTKKITSTDELIRRVTESMNRKPKELTNAETIALGLAKGKLDNGKTDLDAVAEAGIRLRKLRNGGGHA